MFNKRLIVLSGFLLIFSGFTPQNENRTVQQAQLLTRLSDEVQRWTFISADQSTAGSYFTLTTNKLLIKKPDGISYFLQSIY